MLVAAESVEGGSRCQDQGGFWGEETAVGLRLFIVGFSVVLGIARTAGVHSKGYQAVAHLWVGGLFGVAFALHLALSLYAKLRDEYPESMNMIEDFYPDICCAFHPERRRLDSLHTYVLCSGIAISVVELICFLRTLFGGKV
jgi:hypothetical protein